MEAKEHRARNIDSSHADPSTRQRENFGLHFMDSTTRSRQEQKRGTKQIIQLESVRARIVWQSTGGNLLRRSRVRTRKKKKKEKEGTSRRNRDLSEFAFRDTRVDVNQACEDHELPFEIRLDAQACRFGYTRPVFSEIPIPGLTFQKLIIRTKGQVAMLRQMYASIDNLLIREMILSCDSMRAALEMGALKPKR